MKEIYTIGHSTRPIGEFLKLLDEFGIKVLADVRSVPKSAYNPQFHTDNLKSSVEDAGMEYAHLPKLGGLRKTRADSINFGWKNVSFRGYADYMQTEEFRNGLEELEKLAGGRKTAVMCAEAVPWRCHRSLVSDALKADGWKVMHIINEAEPKEHKYTDFLKIKDGRIFYPAENQSGILDL